MRTLEQGFFEYEELISNIKIEQENRLKYRNNLRRFRLFFKLIRNVKEQIL